LAATINEGKTMDTQVVAEQISEKVHRYKREWEERYSSLLVGRSHWKFTAWAELFIIAGLIVALWNVARTSHSELYVLDRTGTAVNYAGSVKPVSMDDSAWDVVRVEQLKKFISAWRSVTSDTAAQNSDWDTAFAFVGENSPAFAVLAKWYQEHDPLKRAAKGELVTVQFKTFDPPTSGSHTYGLWWTETNVATNGQVISTKTWHARIVYAQKIPSNEFARSVNGLGVLATELSFEPVEEAK
jgi:type IV secretory pathway TrbF-like protein